MLLLTLARWAQRSGKYATAGEDETCCNESVDQDISGGISESFDFSTASIPCEEADQGNIESDQLPLPIDARKDEGLIACIDEVGPIDCTTTTGHDDSINEAQHLEHQQRTSQSPHVEAKEVTVDRYLNVPDSASSCQNEKLEKESTIGNCADDEVDDQKCQPSHPLARPALLGTEFLIPELELFFLVPPSQEGVVNNDSATKRTSAAGGDEEKVEVEQGEHRITDKSETSALNNNSGSEVIIDEEEGQIITKEDGEPRNTEESEAEDMEASSVVPVVEEPSDQSEMESDGFSTMPQNDLGSLTKNQEETVKALPNQADLTPSDADSASMTSFTESNSSSSDNLSLKQAGGASTSEIPRHLRACAAQGDWDDNEGEVEELERKYIEAQTMIESLRQEMESSTTRILVLEAEQRESSRQIELYQQELEKTKNERDALLSRVTEIQSFLDVAISSKEQLEKEFEADKKAQNSRVTDMEALISKLERESQSLMQQSESYKSSMLEQSQSYEQENEGLRSENETLKARLDDTIAKFEAQLRQETAKVDDMQLQLEASNSEKEATRAERDELHSLAELAIAERDLARRLVEDIESKNRELTGEMERLSHEKKNADNQIQKLESRIVQKNLLLKDSDRVLDSARNEDDCLTHLSNELEEATYGEEVDLTGERDLKQERIAGEIDQLAQSITKYQDLLNAAETRNAVVTQQLDAYEKTVEALGEEMEASYRGFGREIGRLTVEVAEANSSVGGLEAQLKLSKDEVERLKSEKVELIQRISLIEKEKLDLEDSLDDALSMNDELARDLKVAQAQAESSGRLAQAMGSGIANRKSRQKNLKENLKSLNKQREDLVSKLTSTMDKNIVTVAGHNASQSDTHGPPRKDLNTLIIEAENDLKASGKSSKTRVAKAPSSPTKKVRSYLKPSPKVAPRSNNRDSSSSQEQNNGVSTKTASKNGHKDHPPAAAAASSSSAPGRVRHLPTRVNGKDVTYCGSVVQVEGKTVPHGNGAVRFKDGDLYLGEMEAGSMHGYGTMYPKRGTVLRGRFVKNVFQCGKKMDG